MQDKLLGKIKGSLFGLAIGDALGATLEFMNADEIEEKYGTLRNIIGGGWLHLKAGEVTDDTTMALCIAHSLIDKQDLDLVDIALRYIKWAESSPRDMGRSTRMAIKNLKSGMSPMDSGIPAPSAGNGSIMRCAPIGIAFAKSKRLNDASIKEAAITHANILCTDGSMLVNNFISNLLNGCTLEQAKEKASKLNLAPEVMDTLKGEEIVNPSGYVINTLRAAFYCLFSTSSFEEALIKAVNLGGDADSTGAVTGEMAGAFYGFKNVPKRWLAAIKHFKELADVSEGLYELMLKFKD